LVIFVLEGEGGTEVDGEKVPWKAGDLILLPIKPGGVEHKHFNSEVGKGCKWMAFIYKPFSFLLSSEMVQLEVAPEFSKQVADANSFITGQVQNMTGTKVFDTDDLSALYRSRRGYDKGDGAASKGANGYYGETLRLRDQQRELRRNARWIIRGDALPAENNPQGIMRWYTHPAMKDIVIHTMLFFMQEIPPGSRSGKQLHPGNQVNYVLEGKGHTIIDGVKYAWEAGDVIQLPIRRDGVVFQHFNDDPRGKARFVGCEPNFLSTTGVDRGSGFEQLEVSPDFGKALN
jgi:gentisate 1,2-dioxygenase